MNWNSRYVVSVVVVPNSASRSGSPTPEAMPESPSLALGPSAFIASPLVSRMPFQLPASKNPADVLPPTNVAFPTVWMPVPTM